MPDFARVHLDHDVVAVDREDLSPLDGCRLLSEGNGYDAAEPREGCRPNERARLITFRSILFSFNSSLLHWSVPCGQVSL